MKANEIVTLGDALAVIAEKEVKLSVACKIAEATKTIATHLEVINKKRNAIVLKYSEKDENGEAIRTEEGIRINDVDAFTNEMEALLNEEVEVSLKKISQDDLEGVNVSAKTILGLMPIFE